MKAIGNSSRDPLLALCRYGFYLSVLLFFYGTLFPFRFDLSPHDLSLASKNIGVLPYWDAARGRIHSLPDIASNILLTLPMGFFGFLWFGRDRESQSLMKWFAFGFVLGLLVETIQLAVPSRLSDITDAINNGLGAFIGAIAASLCGAELLDLFSGSLADKKRTCFFILAAVATAAMLLPFDFSADVGQIRWSVRQLLQNPWKSGIPFEDEWVQMVEFAMIGALAGLIRRRRFTASAALLPLVLESAQVLVESHAPSLRDSAMNLAGVLAGMAAARYLPSLIHPRTGFVLLNLAIVAQGLSPYQFAGWQSRAHFEWIPLVEYYHRTTGAALYDAMSGLLTYGLLAALWPRRAIVLWAVLLAGGIEAAQLFIPGRFAGTTDMLIAAIGASTGYALAKASALFTASTEPAEANEVYQK